MRNFTCLLAFVFFSCAKNGNSNPARQNEINAKGVDKQFDSGSQFAFFHELKSNDSVLLGKAYVAYKKDSIFDRLIILGDKNDTLYKVDKSKLFTVEGLDTVVNPDGFYGYKSVSKGNDHFVIVMANKDGNGASDDIEIAWNYEKKCFEILRIP
ncbi:hypothetical protein ACLI1A_07690 [Flavobacterium sp. RHBU_3]|uniref:hypothetical protein n=1 Tax=Flavobacterium sp. RHBU_3 TaxID=3391184 RepID=UPI003985142A